MSAALGEFAIGNIAIKRADIDGYEWVFDNWTNTLLIGSDFDVIPTVLDALSDPDMQQIINRRLGGTCPPETQGPGRWRQDHQTAGMAAAA